MRLIKIQLTNFKRFEGTVSLDLDDRLVALVGPNEAGKSSLLLALERLGSAEPLPRSDRTRNSPTGCAIRGLFVLDEADRAVLDEALASYGSQPVTHVWMNLEEDEDPTWSPSPYPRRDRAQRAVAVERLAALEGEERLDAAFSFSDNFTWDPQLYVDVIALLQQDVENLTDENVSHLLDLADRLAWLSFDPPEAQVETPVDGEVEEPSETSPEVDARRAEVSEALAAAAGRRDDASFELRSLAAGEERPSPAEVVASYAYDHRPAIVQFRLEDRTLEEAYDLSTVIAEGEGENKALRNLAALAELDLNDLNERRADHIIRAEAPLERANDLLKVRVRATWRQSIVYPKFLLDSDGTLRVALATGSSGEYSTPAERSDGLRWFVALHAFLIANRDRVPILLIDEAETHLHYDAQADLVEALMTQRMASKVIYTTHSIGCLPPDLGRGIRAVIPDRDAEISTIANLYWTIGVAGEEKVGFAPLLLGMGASLLALTVPRFGVLTEGPSDAILLPSLFSLVSGEPDLPYRVVPGLSEISTEHMPRLLTHAGNVVCLTDGDGAGEARREMLATNGLPPDRLLTLGGIAPDLTLEDLVTAAAFVHAVNLEIATWSMGAPLDVAQVPDTGRMTWLRVDRPDLERLNKNRVAGQLVDLLRIPTEDFAGDVLDPRYLDGLTSLEASLREILEVPVKEAGPDDEAEAS